MADKNFQLDIVTPARTVFSGEVKSFTAPGVIGNFQVLFNHAPLLSAIGIGEIKVVEPSGKLTRYATSGGFVEVKTNKVILLAESAESEEEINIERAQKSKTRASERLIKKQKETDVERAKIALQRSINRLNIASKK
ncbi:MAG: F0F1 ATP synthase subunit epsilon [Bacteriovoracaceae bacterium]|nr:F0F1 ATP synthase subunit epsilon [Bacteroidota bacterium]